MYRFIIFILILYSCTSENKPNISYFVENKSTINVLFKDMFNLVDSFPLKFKSHERVIPRLRQLAVNGNNEIFVADYSNGTMVRFDEKGEYIEDIGSRGRGPGEFDFIGNYCIDEENKLWVFDPGLLRMNIFNAPGYEYEDTYTIENRIGNFVVFDSDLVALSRKYDKVYLYSHEGELQNQVDLNIYNQDLKIFLTRFNGGGLAISPNKNIFIISPEKYVIHQYSRKLNLIKIIESGTQTSKFRPDPPEFPKNLNPFDITEKHKDWYDTFIHIGRIFILENGLILSAVYDESLKGEYATKIFLNIYTQEGEIIADGLRLPANSYPVAVHSNILYLSSDEGLEDDGTIKPLSIRRYKFNTNRI